MNATRRLDSSFIVHRSSFEENMELSNPQTKKGARHAKKRVGRGPGSGTGKTPGAARRAEVALRFSRMRGFEGGQMPLHRRLPKRRLHQSSRRSTPW